MNKELITFITGGDPDISTTEHLIEVIAKAGANKIALGIPFSDSVIGGQVIQDADERALSAGCTVDKLFAMLKRVTPKVKIPLLFVTYMNPVFVYGIERFLAECAASGISGIIVPDLPFEEKAELAQPCKKAGVTLISMIVPGREKVAESAEGFLYCVSSYKSGNVVADIKSLIGRVKAISDIPCAAGFEISNAEEAREMATAADGIIIDNAIVRLVAEHGRESAEPVAELVKSLRSVLDTFGFSQG